MNIFILLIKAIIRFIGLLLFILLIGCDQRIVNNQEESQFDGVWEMKYTESKPSFIDPGYYVPPIFIEVSSILTFSADSFNLQIIAPASYRHLNREYAGNYSISADTIFFNAIQYYSYKRIDVNNLAALGSIHQLHFKFVGKDSIRFNVISTIGSDGLTSIPMTSFLWNTSGFWPSMRTSGTFDRISTE